MKVFLSSILGERTSQLLRWLANRWRRQWATRRRSARGGTNAPTTSPEALVYCGCLRSLPRWLQVLCLQPLLLPYHPSC